MTVTEFCTILGLATTLFGALAGVLIMLLLRGSDPVLVQRMADHEKFVGEQFKAVRDGIEGLYPRRRRWFW